jgi:hypothetical protein
MEVSINNNINHHQLRFFSNLITMQQLDSKLIAFCTILTVALSIMLSFKQSRFLLLNATITTYSFYNVKKCIKCLRSFKVKSNNNNNSNNNEESNNKNNSNSDLTKSGNDVRLLTYEYLCGYTKYLKLKRLRNIAHKLTTNTIKFNNNSYNYLYRTFNATLLKMKKTTVYFRKSPNNSSTSTSTTTKSSSFFRVKLNRNNKNNENLISQQVNYAETYCPTCTNSKNNPHPKNISSYCSAPVLTGDLTEQDLNNINGFLKTKSESNFNRSRNQNDSSYPKYYNSRVNFHYLFIYLFFFLPKNDTFNLR